MIAMANGRAGWTAALFLCLPVCLPGAAQADFARDIQPIFQQRCIVCHGPRQQMSGLRLDQKDAALKGGYSGAVIQPGNSAGSRLIRLVSGLESKIVMPPIGPRLTDALIGWVDCLLATLYVVAYVVVFLFATWLVFRRKILTA